MVEPHRHEGVFICRGKEDALVTKNLVPGESVYGEKRVSISEGDDKIEYRAWNPFRSKLAAAILGGVDQIHIKPGAKVLYLGAASGTTVSHVSDIVGPDGLVYAVEFSHRSGRDLINLAKKRTNIIPVIEDARHPHKYRMLIAMVDVIFADVAQPDQTRIVALNAHTFLRNGGHFVISIKANCIDSTASAEAVFASEVKKMQQENMKPQEQLTLEPYERDHAVVVGVYRPHRNLHITAKHQVTADLLLWLFASTNIGLRRAPDLLHSVLAFLSLFSGGLFLLIKAMSCQSVFRLILLCII